jgi:hypothetical protein
MPDVTYKITYVVDDAKAVKGLANIDAAIAKTDASLTKLAGKFKTIGQNTPGLTSYMGMQKRVEAALKAAAMAAATTEAALKKVGTGNSALTSVDGRVVNLTAHMAALAAASAGATSGVAGVGAGANIPGVPGGGKGTGGIGSTAGGMARRIATHAAYAAFSRGVNAYGSSTREGKDFFKNAADVASEYRKDLQELAVLQGKTGADDDMIQKDLSFQKETLLNPEDSKTFRLEFGGAISPSLKALGADGSPNITPEVAKDFEVKAAQLTARYGLDPTTGGRMAGLMGVTTKIPSAEAGIGIMEQSLGQLNVEGVGPVKGMASHMLSLSGTMLEEGGGRFKNYPEMAARLAASTVNQAGSAARAKTRIVQSDRLLRKLAGDNESTLGVKAGITDDDDYETAIRKLAPHIAGSGGDKALVDSGFANSTERLAIIEEAKMNGIVDKQLSSMPSGAAASRIAVAKNSEYPTTDTGRQQAAENADFASTVNVGLMSKRLKAAQDNARSRLANPNQPGGQQLMPKGASVAVDLYRHIPGFFSGFSPQEQRVNEEAIRGLVAEGSAVGLDVGAKYPRLANNHIGMGGEILYSDDLAIEFGKASGDVEAARKLNQAGDLIKSAAKDVGRGGGAGGKPPGPQPMRPRNPGGGVNPGRR